jgi:hypothetical protein
MTTLVSDGVDDAPAAPPDEPSTPSSLTRKLATPALVAVVALGVAVRFFSTSSLWLDEALSVNIARLPVGDLLEALRHDGHPPLYYLLLHGWISLFGEGDVAVRALSGVIGLATLPLAYLAGRRLAGPDGGRWSLVVVALSPFYVRYATETRMYGLVMLFVLAGYLVLGDARRAPTLPRLAGLTVITGLLLLTHYWAFYLVAAVGLMLIARWFRTPEDRSTTVRLIVAIAAGGLLFVPWLGGFLYQGAHTGTPWGAPVRPTELVQITLGDLGGGLVSESFLAGTVVVVLALVALFARRSSRTEMTLDLRTTPLVRTELAVVGLTAAIGCVAGLVLSGTYQSRYAAVFVPLLMLAVAVGITRFTGAARLAAGGSFVALSLAGLVWIQTFERTQSAAVADVIEARLEPGDVVVFCPDQLGPAYGRELPDDVTQLSYPTLGSPDRVDWVDYGERNAGNDPAAIADEVRERADGRGIFVVWMGKYRTLEGQCEALVNSLGQGDLIVSGDPAKYYEPANVHWFPAGRADATAGVPGSDANTAASSEQG